MKANTDHVRFQLRQLKIIKWENTKDRPYSFNMNWLFKAFFCFLWELKHILKCTASCYITFLFIYVVSFLWTLVLYPIEKHWETWRFQYSNDNMFKKLRLVGNEWYIFIALFESGQVFWPFRPTIRVLKNHIGDYQDFFQL